MSKQNVLSTSFPWRSISVLLLLATWELAARAHLTCPFRKRHPEITLHYTRFKFPVLAYKFPVLSQKFPVLLRREFRCKPLNLHACRLSKSYQAGGFDEIPC
jgi:hypothetical protein